MTSLTELSSETDFVDRLMQTTHAIVLFMDPTGLIILFNPYMSQLCGYALEEVRGRDWFEQFIPDEDRERLRSVYASGIEGVQIARNINAIVTRSGERRLIEWWADAVHDEHGKILGLVSVGQDITEREALRAKLAESERLASIGMMASIFAHEFGNPLNAMYLQAQLLRRRIDRPDRGPLAPKVDALLGEIQRLSTLLDEFRSYHRPSTLQLAMTDVGELLMHVQHLLNPQATDQQLRIECTVVGELPVLVGNANKLKQVFINLCKNAFEAMRERGEVLRIRAQADTDMAIRVDFSDEGVGIPTDIPDVFAPFATTKSSGMGLGLALVRDIVRAHGGDVTYVSEIGVGTTFTVTLPHRAPAEHGVVIAED